MIHLELTNLHTFFEYIVNSLKKPQKKRQALEKLASFKGFSRCDCCS